MLAPSMSPSCFVLYCPALCVLILSVAGSAMGPFNKLLDLGANIVALDIPGLVLPSNILVVFSMSLSLSSSS
jgi:hypothetical protein